MICFLSQKTYELEALMFRLRQLTAEMAELEKIKQESPDLVPILTPSQTISYSTQLVSSDQLTLHACDLDSNEKPTTVRRYRPQPNEAAGHQLCVVLTEESSSKR